MAARHLMRRGDVPFAVVTHGDDIPEDRTDKKADAAQIAAGGLRLIERAGQKRFDIRLQNIHQNGQRFNIRDAAPGIT